MFVVYQWEVTSKENIIIEIGFINYPQIFTPLKNIWPNSIFIYLKIPLYTDVCTSFVVL